MKISLSVSARLTLLLLLAAAGVWEPRLAIVAVFLCLAVFLSLPPLQGAPKARALGVLGLAAVLSTVGFFRFVVEEAIPGVIAGGRAAAEKHAVAFLRTIVAAQDHMRRSPHIDPDRDGVGSAASLAELSGRAALRSGSVPPTAPLYVTDEQWIPGRAFVSNGAYLYRVCLPTSDGFIDPGEQALPLAEAPMKIDEERAEREYLVYAWPKTFSAGSPSDLYVSDAYERIQLLDQAASSDTATLTDRYYGENAPPPCDLLAQTRHWKAWKGKEPRRSLPGDIPSERR